MLVTEEGIGMDYLYKSTSCGHSSFDFFFFNKIIDLFVVTQM